MADFLDISYKHTQFTFSGNEIRANAAPNADIGGYTRDQFIYGLEVYGPEAPGSGRFVKIGDKIAHEKPLYTEAGISYLEGAVFDIADIAGALLNNTAPTVSVTNIVAVPSHVSPFYTKYGLSYPAQPYATSAIQYAILAKLSATSFPMWVDQYFTARMDEQYNFLTWQADNKIIDKEQPEWLYFLTNLNQNPQVLNLRIKLKFADRTSTIITIKTKYSIDLNTLYSIPTGYNQLGLAAYDSTVNPIIHYTIWLNDHDNSRITEERTYRINTKPSRYAARYIVFANSVGGYDTIAFRGLATEQAKVMGSTVEAYRTQLDLPTKAQLLSQDKYGQNTIDLNTGYFDYEPKYLLELLYSTDVRLQAAEGLLPLINLTESMVYLTELEFLKARTFKFQFANDEQAGNYLPAGTLAPSRPVEWIGVQPYCLIDSFGKRTGIMNYAKLELHYADGLREIVKNAALVANTEGSVGYIAPLASPSCETTPYFNAVYNLTGSFRNATCSGGYTGDYPTITIVANQFGGETQEEADLRAETYAKTLDTQEYANTNGPCNLAPWSYTRAGAPGGRLNIRWYQPAYSQYTSIFGGPAANSSNPTEEICGNSWFCAPPNNTAPGSLWYSSTTPDMWVKPYATGYKMDVYGERTITIYKNGTLVQTQVVTSGDLVGDGVFRFTITGSGSWVAGDMIYVSIVI